jgi:hypothetical protein
MTIGKLVFKMISWEFESHSESLRAYEMVFWPTLCSFVLDKLPTVLGFKVCILIILGYMLLCVKTRVTRRKFQ